MFTESQMAKLEQYNNAAAAQSPAKERLAKLFDDGAYTEIDGAVKDGEGVITAYGYIDGNAAYAFSQDITAKSGAVSRQHAAKICKICDLASRNGIPIIGIYDSDGAFVEDGADAIKAYSEILTWTNNLSGVVPQISVIAGACAGSAALIACSADFVITTDKAELYLAAGADKTATAGTASIAAKDEDEAIEKARKLISVLPANNISSAPEFEFAAPTASAEGDASVVAEAIADEGSIIEISADFGKSAYTAIALIGGSAVGIAATNKSSDKLTSDDCAKLARFVRTCDAFSIPVVTIVDTEGFEKNSGIRDIAKLANAYAEATSLKITVVSGKAYGSAMVALACGNADVTYAYPNAVISPVAPVTAVEFLSHDKLKGAENVAALREKLAADYADEEASAFAAADKGCVDEIITPDNARAKIISVLELMAGKRMNKRLPKKHSNMPF